MSHVPMTWVNRVIRCVRRPTVVSSAYLFQGDRKLSSVTLMSNTGPAAKKQRMDVKVCPVIHRTSHLHDPDRS